MSQNSKKKIILAEPSIPRSKTLSYLKKVLKENFPNEGKYTRIFENKLSKLLNVKYVVACTSGTISIFLGLKGPVVKSHGSTDSFGFYHSIDLCYRIVKGNLMEKIKNNL